MSKHVVEVIRDDKLLKIYRVDENGCIILYTQYPLHKIKDFGFEKFSKQLGEDLIFDNEDLRIIFDL